jgi:hypothetical protein
MRARPKVHVFAGPTLSALDVRRELPAACVHAPIKHGDLGDHIEGGDTAAIVDGFFYQEIPVRHKEILSAMRRGVAVCGASSMGALRAAELASFGMSGVGTVFGWYRDGLVDGDDEVAVLHANADSGWRALSVSMVAVRDALARAVSCRQVGPEEAATALSAVRGLHFSRRSAGGIRDALRRADLDDSVGNALKRQLAANDIKREDAVLLLRDLKSSGLESRGGDPPDACGPYCRKNCGTVETHFQAVWRWQTELIKGCPKSDLVAAAQVMLPSFANIYRTVSLRIIAGDMCEDGQASAFTGLARLEAAARAAAIDRGLLPPDWQNHPEVPEGIAGFMRDSENELWRDTPETREDLAASALVRSCRVAPGVPPAHLTLEFMSEQELDFARQCVEVAEVHNRAAAQRDPRHMPHRVRATAAKELLGQLWGTPVDNLACFERGFTGLEQALRIARTYTRPVADEQLP